MNKKHKEVTSEDLEIKKVAHNNKFSQAILFTILFVIFILTFFCSLFYIGKYYDAKINLLYGSKSIEIKTKYNNALIVNNGIIDKTITDEDVKFNKSYLIEKESFIKISTDKKSPQDGSLFFNVRYDIKNNDFKNNVISNINSDVLVRFMYSYDQKHWEYINNVISTTDSSLNPLMGSYYDIAGLNTNLKVITNFEINNQKGKTTTIYWKCETLLKNIKDNVGKNIAADFKIEYIEN